MQQFSAKKARCLKPAMAGLMAVFVLVLGLFASSSALHSAVHEGTPASHEQCPVCSIVNGQIDVSGLGEPLVVAPEIAAAVVAPAKILAPDSFDYSVALGRGPPDSVVSL